MKDSDTLEKNSDRIKVVHPAVTAQQDFTEHRADDIPFGPREEATTTPVVQQKSIDGNEDDHALPKDELSPSSTNGLTPDTSGRASSDEDADFLEEQDSTSSTDESPVRHVRFAAQDTIILPQQFDDDVSDDAPEETHVQTMRHVRTTSAYGISLPFQNTHMRRSLFDDPTDESEQPLTSYQHPAAAGPPLQNDDGVSIDDDDDNGSIIEHSIDDDFEEPPWAQYANPDRQEYSPGQDDDDRDHYLAPEHQTHEAGDEFGSIVDAIETEDEFGNNELNATDTGNATQQQVTLVGQTHHVGFAAPSASF